MVFWCEKGQTQAQCEAMIARYQHEKWLHDWGSLDAAINTILHKPTPLFCCLMALVCFAACVSTACAKIKRPPPKVPMTYGLMCVALLCMAPTLGYF